MIHLCYLEKQKDKNTFQTDVGSLMWSMNFDDLVLVPDLTFTCLSVSPHIILYDNIDFEKLASTKINNILLVDFDFAMPFVLRNIVNLKSKKTEIIGITNAFSTTLKTYRLEVQNLKEIGLNDDAIAISLILKNNLPPNIVESCMNNEMKSKNLRYENVKEVKDIMKYYKYSE